MGSDYHKVCMLTVCLLGPQNGSDAFKIYNNSTSVKRTDKNYCLEPDSSAFRAGLVQNELTAQSDCFVLISWCNNFAPVCQK